MKNDRCTNEYVVDPKAVAEGKDIRAQIRRARRRCTRKATTARESAIARDGVEHPLCRWCAEQWDEAADELAAEAYLS